MRPVGVVLAGGAGSRIGGEKALVPFEGVPLLERALRTLGAVGLRRAVVAKPDTLLPPLGADVALWHEPREPRHPAVGIAHALACADGAPVLCLAVDLPLLDPNLLRLLLDADDGAVDCVVARARGSVEPLCAIWHPSAGPALTAAAAGSMRELTLGLRARMVDVPHPDALLNVNTPDDLERAIRTFRGG